MSPVTNYMLLYSTLLCKKIARAPGCHKKFMLNKLGGRNKIDPNKNTNTLKTTQPVGVLFPGKLVDCLGAALRYFSRMSRVNSQNNWRFRICFENQGFYRSQIFLI